MEISQILKAMSHPVRLQMVELLLQRRMCVRSQNKVEIVSDLQAEEKIVMQPQKNLSYVNRRIK